MSSGHCKKLWGAIFPFQVESPPSSRTMGTAARRIAESDSFPIQSFIDP